MTPHEIITLQDELRDLKANTGLAVGGSCDSCTVVTIYDRSHWTVSKLLREKLQLYPEYRLSYMAAQGMERSGYRGSREWSWYPERIDGLKQLHIHVDVGCSHEHDCCGCLCNLSYVVEVCSRVIVLTTYKGYNY